MYSGNSEGQDCNFGNAPDTVFGTMSFNHAFDEWYYK